MIRSIETHRERNEFVGKRVGEHVGRPRYRSEKVRYFNVKNGGRTWARTKDPLIKSQLLYQLSYASIPGRF